MYSQLSLSREMVITSIKHLQEKYNQLTAYQEKKNIILFSPLHFARQCKFFLQLYEAKCTAINITYLPISSTTPFDVCCMLHCICTLAVAYQDHLSLCNPWAKDIDNSTGLLKCADMVSIKPALNYSLLVLLHLFIQTFCSHFVNAAL